MASGDQPEEPCSDGPGAVDDRREPGYGAGHLAGWKEAGIHCGERKDQRMDVRAGRQRREKCGERAPGHHLWTERMADGDYAGREQAGVFGYSFGGATVMGEVPSGWTGGTLVLR